MSSAPRLQLVVFDLAGTTVDCGCFSPVVPSVEAFGASGVALTVAEARGPMGLAKRDHIAALLALPQVGERWRAAHGGEPDDAAVTAVYDAFMPLQLEAARSHAELVSGVLAVQASLRARGLGVVTTTGYFRAAAEVVWQAMARQGFCPDLNVCPDDVGGRGRPAPAMIHHAREVLGIDAAEAVVKVGDTVPDIAEGLAAGAWSLGVTHTGSDVGCAPAELRALPAADREARLAAAQTRLLQAGAHGVMPSVAGLPSWIDAIDAWLAAGRRP